MSDFYFSIMWSETPSHRFLSENAQSFVDKQIQNVWHSHFYLPQWNGQHFA
jgi:hypothetical protein